MKQKITQNIIFYSIFIIIIILNIFNTTFVASDYGYSNGYLLHLDALHYNPYYSENPYAKYPALYYYFMGLLGLFGVNTIWELKLIWGIIDLIVVFYIKKMSTFHFNKRAYSSYLIPTLYFFNPLHWYCLKTGENDIFSLFFLLIAFDLFLKEKYNLSAIILTLGIMFKVFPIFLLIPVSVFFLNRKRLKELIKYWIIVGICFVLISLPYLILYPDDYFKGIFLHSSRQSTGNSYAPVATPLYQRLFSIFGIEFSYLFLIQIICFLIISLVFLFYFKDPSRDDMIFMTLISLLVPSILSLQDQHTVFLRYLPFLLFFLINNENISKNILKKGILTLATLNLVLFILLIHTQEINPTNELQENRDVYYFYCILYFIFIFYYSKESPIRKTLIFIDMQLVFELAQGMEYYYGFSTDYKIVIIVFYLRVFLLYPFLLLLLIREKLKKDQISSIELINS